MAEKHYFNDYKKIMGVDESRTASQKLLDRALGKRQAPQTTILKPEQPQKKIKKQLGPEAQINNQEALNKIMKVLGNKNNLSKIQKGLQVLKKCCDGKQFLESLSQDKIKQIIETLINLTSFSSGTLNEHTKLSQIQKTILTKVKEHVSTNYKEKMPIQNDKMELECLLLNLVTDDSFNFAKDINNLKFKIFEAYKNEKINQQKDEQEGQKNNKQSPNLNSTELNSKDLCLHIQSNILNKILTLPNLHLEWVKSGVINFLKQFIVEHKQKLAKPKQFLSQYNKLLQGKKSNQQAGSYDIMGSKKGNAGGSYTAVIQQQDATSTWCKRQ